MQQHHATGPDADLLVVPDLGAGVECATLIKWLVGPGDVVAEGDAVAEVEAEKVNVEVPAPRTVRIAKLLADVGSEVRVGAPIARVLGS